VRRQAEEPGEWMVPGALAEYAPVGPHDPFFACVIDSEPWQLGHGAWVVKIRDLDDAYKTTYKRGHGPAGGVCIEFIRPRQTFTAYRSGLIA